MENNGSWKEEWLKLMDRVDTFRKLHDLTMDEFMQVIGEDNNTNTGFYLLRNRRAPPSIREETKSYKFAVKVKEFMNSERSEMPLTWKIIKESTEKRLIKKLKEALRAMEVEACNFFINSKEKHLIVEIMCNKEFMDLVNKERVYEVIRKVHEHHFGIGVNFNKELYELIYIQTYYL